MTRFWITQEEAGNFVLNCIKDMKGGEIFIPRLPSTSIMELIKETSEQESEQIDIIGIRQGEKLHECLITKEESRNTIIEKDRFIITQTEQWNADSWEYSSRNKIKNMDMKNLKGEQ